MTTTTTLEETELIILGVDSKYGRVSLGPTGGPVQQKILVPTDKIITMSVGDAWSAHDAVARKRRSCMENLSNDDLAKRVRLLTASNDEQQQEIDKREAAAAAKAQAKAEAEAQAEQERLRRAAMIDQLEQLEAQRLIGRATLMNITLADAKTRVNGKVVNTPVRRDLIDPLLMGAHLSDDETTQLTTVLREDADERAGVYNTLKGLIDMFVDNMNNGRGSLIIHDIPIASILVCRNDDGTVYFRVVYESCCLDDEDADEADGAEFAFFNVNMYGGVSWSTGQGNCWNAVRRLTTGGWSRFY